MNKKYHLGIIGSTIFYQTFHQLLLEKENAITIHHATIEDALDDNDKYLECLKCSNYLFFEKANATYSFLIENALKLSKHIFINQSSLSKNQILECHHIVTEANLKCILLQPDNFYLHLKNIDNQQTEHLTFEFKYPQSEAQNLIDFFR
ncbi:MAG: hypothetical protein UZ11_BCD004001961 [Bacteroidetes bacterium OLB11]|nr:MAG: hypothetical protein UZ11_BCD004001961 [Bacteroidetes bacterium OLB11]